MLSFPKKVLIQTHSRCNASCKFCPYFSLKEINSHGKMNDDLFYKIIDECAENKSHVDNIMPYLMNEPLLDSLLEKKINYIKSLIPDVSVHILTNGFLLDEKRQDSIISSKLDWIGISFFSLNEKKYENAMGLPFSIAKPRVDSFIQKAIQIRGSEFVMMTLFKWENIQHEEVEDAIEYWKKLGVKRISHYEKGISRAGNVEGFDFPQVTKMTKCHSIWSNELLHILYNGDVVLCCMDWKRKHILGNLRDQTIREIWNSDKYHDVRKQLRGEKTLNLICRNCEMAVSG